MHPRTSGFSSLTAVVSLVLVSAPAAQQKAASLPTLRDVMRLAATATAAFEREFAAVVADEHYVQRAGRGGLPLRRETRSDLLLVRVPDRDSWLPFRDVYEVDGRAVRDRTERLQKLFLDAPQTAVGAATSISNESSRYNIGSVIRTINVPTFGLLLLRPEYQRRFEFRKQRDETISGIATWRVAFEERIRPTVVRTITGADVPLEGSLWIEPGTGRVLKTLVKTIGTPDPGVQIQVFTPITLMWVETTFAPSDTIGIWVPDKMTEWARAENRSEVSGSATYSHFRRFTVNTAEAFQER